VITLDRDERSSTSAASSPWWRQAHLEQAVGDLPAAEVLGIVLEHLPDAVTISTAVRDERGCAVDMRLEYMNGVARAGQPHPEQAIGGLCSELWPDLVVNGSFDACMRVLDSGVAEGGSFEWSDHRTYRTAAYDWRAVRVASDTLVWVLRDDTDRQDAVRELRRSEADADRANRAKSDFLSRMSHELRTPLNSIMGFSQLMELDPLSPDQQDSLVHIQRAGRHLLDLVNEVLDIARIEAGRLDLSLEPVDVVEITRAALDLLHPPGAQSEISFVGLAVPEGTTYVRADRQRLLQVLLNLVSNGIKYNQPGGEVVLHCEASGGTVTISVRDTGTGIPRELHHRLFQPFERLGVDQGAVEGTGVGLALSRGLVEKMGGILSFSSEVGVGSVFTVELPQAPPPDDGDEGAEPEGGAASIDPDGAHLRTDPFVVLYVEDNLANLRLIERVLTRRPGVQIITAIQGGLGAELAREHQPDLILLDLHLPDMHGSELLATLRAHAETAEIPVAVVSADATSRAVDRLLQEGADAYLTKPLDIVELLGLVDSTRAARPHV
jgi:signal transduction histidine kinase/ActR/RegA family two-component response regulator